MWQRPKTIIHLDDDIVAVKGKAEATVESVKVKQDLESAGLIVNIEKCIWEPSCKIEWLGLALVSFQYQLKRSPLLKLNCLKPNKKDSSQPSN